MELKEKITRHFDKSKFELLNCETAPDGDWEGVDEYIRDFIKRLNKCEHISTLFSCEGHKENDDAYLFFNVSQEGWDIFWQKVLPELSYKFCFIDKSVSETGMYMLNWYMMMSSSDEGEDVTTGISIHTQLSTFNSIKWTDKKERFWNTIKETFLKYYKAKEEILCPKCKSNEIETRESLRRTGGPRVPGKLMSYGYYLEIHICKKCSNIWDGKEINNKL